MKRISLHCTMFPEVFYSLGSLWFKGFILHVDKWKDKQNTQYSCLLKPQFWWRKEKQVRNNKKTLKNGMFLCNIYCFCWVLFCLALLLFFKTMSYYVPRVNLKLLITLPPLYPSSQYLNLEYHYTWP